MSAYEEAMKLNAETNARFKEIQFSREMTPEAKRREVHRLWTEYGEKMPALSERYTREVKAKRADAEATMRDLYAPAGDPSSLRDALERARVAREASYRDRAVHEADNRPAGEPLLELLEQARETSDHDLATAVFMTANKAGFHDVTEAYLNAYPHKRGRFEQAQARFAEVGPEDLLNTPFAASMPNPPAL